MANWSTVDTMPYNRPVLLRLDREVLNSNIHVGIIYSNTNMGIVAGRFLFDLDANITHWCEIPTFKQEGDN